MAYFCEPCNRYFRDEVAIRQHMLASSRHDPCLPLVLTYGAAPTSYTQRPVQSKPQHHCQTCNVFFSDTVKLEDHYVLSIRHHYCRSCRVHFASREALKSHLAETHRDRYCRECDLLFDIAMDLEGHRTQNPRHHYCKDCRVLYNEASALKAHYVHNPRHHYCKQCDILFDAEEGLDHHCIHSDEHHYCSPCKTLFDQNDDLDDHNREYHWYCEECKRVFQEQSNLKAHLASSLHSARKYHCIADDCRKSFLNEGDVIAHWETGTCRSGITRYRVNEAFLLADFHRLFVDDSLLEENHDGDLIPPDPLLMSKAGLQIGGIWECSCCYQKFQDRASVQAHVDSPVHEPEFYVCPEGFEGCRQTFSTLSALVSHCWTSTSCTLVAGYLEDPLFFFRHELFPFLDDELEEELGWEE